jgi:hypothetical protein
MDAQTGLRGSVVLILTTLALVGCSSRAEVSPRGEVASAVALRGCGEPTPVVRQVAPSIGMCR